MTEIEKDQNKERSEEKTFPVPFSLEEIKNSNYISNTSNTKASQEQIINQTFKFDSEGNIREAVKYYQHYSQ